MSVGGNRPDWLESGKHQLPPPVKPLPPKQNSLKLGLRARLFLISAALMSVALIGGGVYLEQMFRAQMEKRIENELIALARISNDAVQIAPADASREDMQNLATRLGASAEARVTIVAKDGTVLGDSAVDPRRVPEMENHANRPEIAVAHDKGIGVSRRHSDTLNESLLYAAVPYDTKGRAGVVRVALPLRDVEHAVGQLRIVMSFAAVMAIAFSVFISFVSAHYVTKTIRDLFSVARALVRVEPAHLAESPTGDEIGGLAGSINEMAQAFGETVGTLARERDRFGAVLEGMGEAVVALDGEARITLCNRAALRLLGWKDAPIGRTLLEAIRLPALHDLARSADGRAEPQEVEVATREGKRLLARAAHLSGSDRGAVLVMRDVTELRRLENVRRDFVANVSHELRTPVSTMRATAEALVGGALDDPDHALRFCNSMLRNAERLSTIISDLLDLSRIEAGEQSIDIQPVVVASAIHRAVEVVEDAASKRNLTIDVNVEEGLTALADEAALDHMMLNLVDNAVKYTPDGGNIQLWAGRDEDKVRIEVRDDGPGVPERHRTRIFERFYRVDTGRSRALGGTGLGLSIVRHLADAMGADVGFRPNEPKGSVFWVELPATDRLSAYPDRVSE